MIKRFENILYLGKNFKITKPPGKLFTQNFFGKFDEKVFCPILTPKTNGLIDKEPVICLQIIDNFFLFLMIETTVINLSSQRVGYVVGIVFSFFLDPLEKTVTCPLLLRPAQFLKKILKSLLGFENFNKNIDFLKRCVDVIGL